MQRLDELMRAAGLEALMRQAGLATPPLPVPLAGLTADSREVAPGFLFAALPGAARDGRAYIAEAVRRGAAAVLAPSGTAWPDGVPKRPLILSAEPRQALARLAASFAGPQPRHLVAVTGTNGKTSTVDFLRQIWTRAGHKAASLGTLGLIAPGHQGGAGLTTPDPVHLAGTLAALRRDGIDHAALEASSHGLAQARLDGVKLAAAGFVSFSRDHLDYHGTLEAYRAAKLRLFADLLPRGAPAFAIAGLDPATLSALRDTARAAGLALHLVGEAGDWMRLRAAQPTAAGQALTVEHDGIRQTIELGLPGRFQADNALLAASLAEATGVADALAHLPQLQGVRGRLEHVTTLANGAAVYVDYAHTPDALARLLAALRPHARRLVVVFGAGGNRDAGKRAPMGAAVAAGADLAIVTDDNPRDEDPAAIRAALRAFCPGAIEIADRRDAIAAGLAALGPGDVLAIAGKGHEQGQRIGAETLPFDDAAVARDLAGDAA